jgi:hypothetical protein
MIYIFYRFLLVCSLCIVICNAKAQYASIPDGNFRYALITAGLSTSCFDGTQTMIDTTCPGVLNMINLGVFSYNINDLTGIQYFKGLQSFGCGMNNITSLPTLPPHLKTLTCSNNPYLSFFSILPDSLAYLDCSNAHVFSLPTLPSALKTLNCSQNTNIHSLPVLPNGLTSLNTFSTSITALPAHMPDSLTFIDCSFDSISSLPIFPNGLLKLYCEFNQITTISSLPNTITGMDISQNQLNVCPVFPTSLLNLTCGGNHYNSLSTFPVSLETLDVQDGVLTSLPVLTNCANLYTINCRSNHLISLPTLPNSLSSLDCSYNNITVLPPLDTALTQAQFNNNQLTFLPRLPVHLLNVNCNNNLLTSLPELPQNDTVLNCAYNNLSSLPFLPPSLTQLYCNNNPNLTCLPIIYAHQLNDFYIGGSGIYCRSNLFTASSFDISPDTLSLCNPSSGCPFYYNIAGIVYLDTTSGCQADSLMPGFGVSNIKVQLLKNAKVVQQCMTSYGGLYSFFTDSLSGYDILVDTSFLQVRVQCPSGNDISVSASTLDSVQLSENFGITSTQVSWEEYGVVSITPTVSHSFRNSIPTIVNIVAGNVPILKYNSPFYAGKSGTVTTTLSGPVSFAGPAPGAYTPDNMTREIVVYHVGNLDTISINSFKVIINTDSGAVVGTEVCITTVIAPDSFTAAVVAEDTLTQCYVVHNPHDPNLKQVYPTGNIDTGAAQWLTYTIYFQNTGNDTAYTVVVKDTLSAYADASTFQYLASSHKAVIQLFGSAMAFTFPKISLVDSATNPSLSEGWIQYKVKSKPNLPLYTQIKNTAYIYFDANPAIVTNTTLNTVDTATIALGIKPIAGSGITLLYPNPNKGSFTLQTAACIGSDYIISDMLGNMIAQQAIRSNIQAIELPEAIEGVYTLTVKGARPVRFVIVR